MGPTPPSPPPPWGMGGRADWFPPAGGVFNYFGRKAPTVLLPWVGGKEQVGVAALTTWHDALAEVKGS